MRISTSKVEFVSNSDTLKELISSTERRPRYSDRSFHGCGVEFSDEVAKNQMKGQHIKHVVIEMA